MQITLKRVSRLFLWVSGFFRIVLIKPIAVVPRRPVRLPCAQTNPAKLRTTSLVLAYHMIASAVFFYSHMTFRAFFRIGRYPIRGLWVVVALFYPLFEPSTLDRVVPQLTAAKTKNVTTRTLHLLCVKILSFNGVWTIRRRAPPHQAVAFDKAICYQVLIFYFNNWIIDQRPKLQRRIK